MNMQQTVWVVSNINEKKLLPLAVDQVTNLSDLPEVPPFAVILSKSEDQDWVELITSLRARKAYRFTPIFYHGDVESKLQYLFDGSDDIDITEKATQIHELITHFDPGVFDSVDKELVLMAYLYSRPNFLLKGHVSYESPYIYEFPLLKVLFSEEVIVDEWRFLEDLTLRNLLVQEALIDEIKMCVSCESGLLNIKNSCPSCHSIDIKSQKFVHCFSCGKIGPVPEFLRENRLICSRCNVKLDDIGVDYEKPKEDKLCNNCGNFFAESQVEAVCLVCHRNSLPQELTSRRLYDYGLTRRGEYLVHGIEKNLYREFNHFFKVIDHSAFMLITSWQSKLAKRYSSVYFTVLTLQITNEAELIANLGSTNSERLMGLFFTGLCQAFRESDISSRQEGTMYFFLPMVNQDGCLTVIERIKQTIELLAEEMIGTNFAASISYMTSAEIIENERGGDLLIAELQARLLEHNVCTVGSNEGE